MNWSPEEEPRIVGYLLGQLPEEDRSEIERRYFEDTSYLADVEAVEVELIDDYLDGSLDSALARQFEEHYLSAPAQRAKVDFARVLRTRRSPMMAPVWRYAWAATTVMLAAGLSWSLYQIFRLESSTYALQKQVADQQEQRARLEQKLARPAPVIAFYFLSPGSSRAMAQRQEVVVPKSVSTIRLHLALEASAKAPSYHATLQTFDQRTVWDWQTVLVRRTLRGRSVELDLPAAEIDAGEYIVAVDPASPGAPSHQSYVFRLIKND